MRVCIVPTVHILYSVVPTVSIVISKCGVKRTTVNERCQKICGRCVALQHYWAKPLVIPPLFVTMDPLPLRLGSIVIFKREVLKNI